MTTALLDAPRDLFSDACRPVPTGRGRVTLEERLDEIWLALQNDSRAECPICHGAMSYDEGAGHCASCGSTLS